MKLLVFAHTPPPHHGQSRMIQLLLDGLGGDRGQPRPLAPSTLSPGGGAPGTGGIECYHVNARVSEDLADAGTARWIKVPRLLGHCAQAIWRRWRWGVRVFYYVPAPPKRASLYRDWLVMLCCRPFFRKRVFHWHAVGLGEWLERQAAPWERWLGHQLLDGASLAIVLSKFSRTDAERFRPRRIEVVTNGIADPCPDFAGSVAPRRAARLAARRKLLEGGTPSPAGLVPAGEQPETVQVLFLAHCTRDKGLFDTVEGVRLANRELAARRLPLHLNLVVVGGFVTTEERLEFDRILDETGAADWVRYAGFVQEPEKLALLRDADLFCFPTYFANEGQPANLIEAMAFGLPAVVTRWRAVPEFIPEGYAGLIEPRQPGQVAAALLALLTEDGARFRDVFMTHFTLDTHLKALAAAIRTCDG